LLHRAVGLGTLRHLLSKWRRPHYSGTFIAETAFRSTEDRTAADKALPWSGAGSTLERLD
jgi:hypothetical protein